MGFFTPCKPPQNSLIDRLIGNFDKMFYIIVYLKVYQKPESMLMLGYINVKPHSALGQLSPTEFLLKFGTLNEFTTFQQDNNSKSDWNY